MKGRRILITRAEGASSSFAGKLREKGAIPIEIPLIRILPAEEEKARVSLNRLEEYDWLLFTSANGVDSFFALMERLGIGSAKIRARVISIGPKTTKRLKAHGFPPEIEAKEYRQEGLTQDLRGNIHPGERLLFPRGDLAREAIVTALKAWGVDVTDPIVYVNRPNREGAEEIRSLLNQGGVDMITFTSPSAFQALYDVLAQHGEESLLRRVKIACIGPVTAERVSSLGFQADVTAKVYTVEGLIEAMDEEKLW